MLRSLRSEPILLLLGLALPIVAAGYEKTVSCDTGAVFRDAQAQLSENQFDEAATTLGPLRACPNLSQLQTFQLGWLFGQSRHFDTALQIFKEVPPDVPDKGTHTYAIALSNFELARYGTTVQVLKQELATSPLDAKSANLLAVAYSKQGLYKDAYRVLSTEMEKHGNDLTTYLNLATVCAEGGDFAQSAVVAAKATEHFPGAAEAFIFNGAANTLLGHLDQAYTNFKEAARLAPDKSEARFLLATTEYGQGNFAGALETLQTADKDGLADSDLNYLTAECLLKIDGTQTQAALAQLNQAIKLDSRSTSALTLRGKLLLETGHAKEALPDLELAAQVAPDSHTATYNLARAYRSLGRTADAQRLFAKLRTSETNGVAEAGNRRANEALRESSLQ